MPISQNYSSITIGGPCKVTIGSTVFYTEGNAQLEPVFNLRDIPSSAGGEQDKIATDLHWKLSFTPKSVYSATIAGVLIPSSYTNFTVAGGRMIGAANVAVTVLGADGDQYVLTRAGVTKMPDVWFGLGKSIWGPVEVTAYLGTGDTFAGATSYFTYTTGVSWSQSDFPTGHQEAECTLAWGSVTGWDTVFAEDGFQLTHELKTEPIKQGNVVIDQKILSYRAMLKFKPQEPTSAQLLAALPTVGVRLSANANNAVLTGAGITFTGANMALYTGHYNFDNKLNRHGEWGLITSLTTPGTRLTFA